MDENLPGFSGGFNAEKVARTLLRAWRHQKWIATFPQISTLSQVIGTPHS
jgi:hypothetical protein